MGLSTVTPPATEPVTVVEAKSHCRIDVSEDDGLIAGYIVAAREWVENATHLRLVTQTLDMTIDDDWPCVLARGYYRQRIEFPVKPVASVTSVTYVDENGATQTLNSSQYVVRTDGAVAFIEPAYNVTWPNVRRQSSAITVRFVAGQADSAVPNTLTQAIRLLTAHQHEQRQPVVVGTSVSELPLAIEALISSHRFTRLA